MKIGRRCRWQVDVWQVRQHKSTGCCISWGFISLARDIAAPQPNKNITFAFECKNSLSFQSQVARLECRNRSNASECVICLCVLPCFYGHSNFCVLLLFTAHSKAKRASDVACSAMLKGETMITFYNARLASTCARHLRKLSKGTRCCYLLACLLACCCCWVMVIPK